MMSWDVMWQGFGTGCRLRGSVGETETNPKTYQSLCIQGP